MKEFTVTESAELELSYLALQLQREKKSFAHNLSEITERPDLAW